VIETHAALGVAFDGDADRAMFVSASGRHVDGDGVLLAMARFLKSTGHLNGGRVIGTTMANLGLERALQAEGLSLAREPVGDRYVLEEMLRSGANLGGEQSGHDYFLDDAHRRRPAHGPQDGLPGGAARPLDDLLPRPQDLSADHCEYNGEIQTAAGIVACGFRRDQQSHENPRNRRARRRALFGTEPKARVMVEAERAEDVTTGPKPSPPQSAPRSAPEFSQRL